MSGEWEDRLGTLEGDEPAALELLGLLAFLAPAPLPGPDLAVAEEKVGCSAGVLVAAGLLQTDDDSVTVTAEVASAARARLSSAAGEELLARALAFVDSAFPAEPEEVEGWPRCEALAPHALAVVDWLEKHQLHDVQAVSLYGRLSAFRLAHGDFNEALEVTQRGLSRSSWATEAPEYWTLLRVHGSVLTELDELQTARQFLAEAVEAHSRLLDPDHDEVKRDRISLAAVLAEADELAEAQQEVEAVLAAGGRPDRLLYRAHGLHGWILLKLGEAEAARASCEQALALTRELEGPRHPETAEAHNGLGVLFDETNRIQDARRELEAAVEIGSAALGDGHPTVAAYRSNLGAALYRGGELRVAQGLLERSLEIGEATLPEHHRAIWIRNRTLASILAALEELDPALRHAEAAAAITEQADSALGSQVAADLALLGSIHRLRRELTRARSCYEEALRATGAESQEEAVSAGYALALGRIHWSLGELAAARSSFEDALLRYREREAEEPTLSIAPLIGMAEVLVAAAHEMTGAAATLDHSEAASGISAQAEEMFAKTMESLLQKADPKSAIAISDACLRSHRALAHKALEMAQGQVDQDDVPSRLAISSAWQRFGREMSKEDAALAERAFRQALSNLGDFSHYEGVLLHDLGNLLFSRGDHEAAADRYRKAVDLKRATERDADLRSLGVTIYALGRSLEEMKDFDGAVAAYEERLEILGALQERDPHAEGAAYQSLGDVRRAQGEIVEAASFYEQAVDRKREAGDAKSLAQALNALGRCRRKLQELGAAEEAYREQLRVLSRLKFPEPQLEGVALHDLGDIRQAQGNLEDAVGLYRKAVDLKRQAGENPADLALTLGALGRGLKAIGDFPAAQLAFEERLEVLRGLGSDQADLEGFARRDIADSLRLQDMWKEAAEAYRTAIDRMREASNVDGRALVTSQMWLTAAQLHLGEAGTARKTAGEVIETLRSEAEPDPYRLSSAFVQMGAAAEMEEEPEAALGHYLEADQMMGTIENPNRLERAALKLLLAEVLEKLGRDEERAEAKEAARLQVVEAFESGETERPSIAMPKVLTLCVDSGAMDQADQAIDRVRSQLHDEGDEATVRMLGRMLLELGRARLREEDRAGALSLFEEASERLAKLPDEASEGSDLADQARKEARQIREAGSP